jgi:hypothetical protein
LGGAAPVPGAGLPDALSRAPRRLAGEEVPHNAHDVVLHRWGGTGKWCLTFCCVENVCESLVDHCLSPAKPPGCELANEPTLPNRAHRASERLARTRSPLLGQDGLLIGATC